MLSLHINALNINTDKLVWLRTFADGPARTATSRMAIAATANAAAGMQAPMQLPARSVVGVQPSAPQAEMTINLLAEEQTDVWRQPLMQSMLPAGVLCCAVLRCVAHALPKALWAQ